MSGGEIDEDDGDPEQIIIDLQHQLFTERLFGRDIIAENHRLERVVAELDRLCPATVKLARARVEHRVEIDTWAASG